ncbi:hypothetical protein H6F93_30730 [Leptolyngbya sp. FACHB-671]|uniref:hypothetical protein n=1 Tax=Leptolyngbya sp. FACHB-671 TaxID=2692812 RepID=UPI0016866694|nr:hypothetical protein [Leptolyngbya sp. FACHB-671]MBD2071846.1 hypothetical protein [Leptolyngbya sp. FACHB-671]
MSEQSKTSIFRKESLERLSSPEQLDQLMQVVSPKSWLPLASLASLMALALVWGFFGRIPITAVGKGILVHPTQSSNELVGLTYFGSDEAKQIQPGMEIMLVPDTIGSEQTDGLVARIKSVSEPSVTTLDAARQSGITDQENLVEVVAELEPDPSTASGYRWSSARGTRLTLAPGMSAIARITLAEKAPITFVFPFLEVSH